MAHAADSIDVLRFPASMKAARLLILLTLSLSSATAAEPFRPNLGPDLPRITVTCGDVTLLLRRETQWTPGRIDFRGKPMTTEKSAYGTVFSFPGVGFIGTAHLENEPEPLTSVTFELDGKEIATPAAELSGQTFRFVRESVIRGIRLRCEFVLRDNQLHETTTFSTTEAVPLKLVYHFMHAWQPSMSEYLAGIDAAPDEAIGGPLENDQAADRKFYIQRRVDWMAVYEPAIGQYAVSRLVAAPESGGHISMLWNALGAYRKYYLRCFTDETVPAGFSGTWRMVTGFGAAGAGEWKAGARAQAEALKESE